MISLDDMEYGSTKNFQDKVFPSNWKHSTGSQKETEDVIFLTQEKIDKEIDTSTNKLIVSKTLGIQRMRNPFIQFI
jgi:hypothetical protein